MAWKRRTEIEAAFTRVGDPRTGSAIYLVKADREAMVRLDYEERRRIWRMANGSDPGLRAQMQLLEEARRAYDDFQAQTRAQGVSRRFARLFGSRNKKEQERLVATQLGAKEFCAAVFNCEAAGYAHEAVTYDFVPDHLEPGPSEIVAFQRDRSSVEGRRFLRKLVAGLQERKHIVVHLFREIGDDYWHSIYFTGNDLKGEHWAGGSHAHYLSPEFIRATASEFLERFDSANWKEQGEHIPLHEDMRRIVLDPGDSEAPERS